MSLVRRLLAGSTSALPAGSRGDASSGDRSGTGAGSDRIDVDGFWESAEQVVQEKQFQQHAIATNSQQQGRTLTRENMRGAAESDEDSDFAYDTASSSGEELDDGSNSSRASTASTASGRARHLVSKSFRQVPPSDDEEAYQVEFSNLGRSRSSGRGSKAPKSDTPSTAMKKLSLSEGRLNRNLDNEAIDDAGLAAELANDDSLPFSDSDSSLTPLSQLSSAQVRPTTRRRSLGNGRRAGGSSAWESFVDVGEESELTIGEDSTLLGGITGASKTSIELSVAPDVSTPVGSKDDDSLVLTDERPSALPSAMKRSSLGGDISISSDNSRSASKRVSFGGLSPISPVMDDSFLVSSTPPKEASKRSVLEEEEDDIHSSRLAAASSQDSPSTQPLVVSSKRSSVGATPSTVSNLSGVFDSEAQEEAANVEEEPVGDDDDYHYDNGDAGGDDGPWDDEPSRKSIGVGVSTSFAALHTPDSRRQRRRQPNRGVYTPSEADLTYISTPGSREFPTAQHFEQETFEGHTQGDDLDTDAEDNGISASDVTTVNEVVDRSFLRTIDGAKSKYAGRTIREETRKLHQEERQALRTAAVKHAKKRSRELASLMDDDFLIDSIPEPDPAASDESADWSDEDYINGLERRGIRRSRRATKGRRFAFWKGERPVYEEGAIVGILRPPPTPVKPSRRATSETTRPRPPPKKRTRSSPSTDTAGETEFEGNSQLGAESFRATEVLPPVEIPPEYNYVDPHVTDRLSVFNDNFQRPVPTKVISCLAALESPSELPLLETRLPTESKAVGLADVTLSAEEVPGVMSGWVSGYIRMPPGAIKDAETVDLCTQIFFVTAAQPESLEFALADPNNEEFERLTAQRVLLSAGDSFYVPAGNAYRLENHSKQVEANISFVAVRQMQQVDSNDSGASVATVVSGVQM